MKKADDISDEHGKQLVQLLEEIVSKLPAGVATLETSRTRDNQGTIVFLRPANENSATFSAHTEDGRPLVDVSFGQGTTFELPWEAKLPNDASFATILDAVRAMCLAVIEGKCEDRLGLLSITGTIRVSETKCLRVTNFFQPNLRIKTIQYAPYHPLVTQ